MEELEPDIILAPAKLVVTKQSLEIIQTEMGRHQFEIYQLIGDVVGFELVRQPPSPASTSKSLGGGNFLVLVFVASLFGSLAYGARATNWSNIDFFLPAFIAFFCLVVMGDRLFFQTTPPGLDYALRIRLATAPDKLLPCASRKEVQIAVSEIYTFIHSGAYFSHVVVRNHLVSMMTQTVRHTPAV